MKQLAFTGKISSIALRYFNVLGAHKSGNIGDNYFAQETNLLGYIFRTILGKQNNLSIYGNTFPTPDGTAIRDYIDVNDLVDAHLSAYRGMKDDGEKLSEAYNVGNGK